MGPHGPSAKESNISLRHHSRSPQPRLVQLLLPAVLFRTYTNRVWSMIDAALNSRWSLRLHENLSEKGGIFNGRKDLLFWLSLFNTCVDEELNAIT